MEKILEVNNIVKKYNNNLILDNLSLSINKGDIYGFVGKNGAGKTTLIRILSGLVDADSGDFKLFGISSDSPEISKARKKVCTMVESPALYLDLSARDNMKMQCLITKQSYNCIDDLLSFVDLSHTGKKLAKDFSLGMRQRLGIAMSLVSKPELMLLDEPINGLDPEGIRQVRELLLKMHKEKNITILISSHILTELSLLATRYGFIDKGYIVKESTFKEIMKETTDSCYIESDYIEKAKEVLEKLGYYCEYKDNGIYVSKDINLMMVCDEFKKNKISLTKHIKSNVDLEGYFMNLLKEI